MWRKGSKDGELIEFSCYEQKSEIDGFDSKITILQEQLRK